jgi:tRNA(Ile)-lysidine synthase TilS/MesJ
MSSGLSYSQWKKEHKSFLETLPSKQVFLLFSGGKDSSVTMDLISKAGKEFGFGFEAHGAAFPVHRYSHEEMERISSYWNDRGEDLVWHKSAETDERLKGAENPCVDCQGMRKKMLKTRMPELVTDWKRLVLIISFSLSDLVSYAIEHILADAFAEPEEGKRAVIEKRYRETAQRFYPLLKMKEGYTVFRPLIKYNTNEMWSSLLRRVFRLFQYPANFRVTDQREYWKAITKRWD